MMQPTTSDPASLANLYDIIVPQPVSLWPLAPGWYGLAWVALVVLAVWAGWRLRQWRLNRYRRVALAELDQLEAAARDPSRRLAVLGALPTLVKRVALAVWPRETVASLSGPSLLAFLDATGQTQAFQVGPGKDLPMLAYDTKTAAALDDEHIALLFDAVREWIKRHHTPSSPSIGATAQACRAMQLGSEHDHV
jgi:hypothetical protein